MKRYKHLISFILLFSLWGTVEGQVTIGSTATPQKFAVLELVSNSNGGIRLPHLTTAQRDALSRTKEFNEQKNRGNASADPGLGLGLTIYNTDTNCTEYWNGYKWVSLCMGTANITLKSPCGDYDPQNIPEASADGNPSNCEYTPVDEPACTVPSGKAYEVYLTVGATYSNLQVDELTATFTIGFLPNSSSMPRNAVVRVVNNCTGEFKDFVFTQSGGVCTGEPDPVLNVTNLSLCAGGSVFAHVTNAVEGVDYLWTYAGVIVHTGSWYEIRRPGVYKVYTGLLGCGTPAELTVADNSSSDAPFAITINATNGGILCAGGNVVLTANTAQTVLWYHNGIPLTGSNKNNNPLLLTGAPNAGDWFAVVDDQGGCISRSSNTLTLTDNTTVSSALETPQAKVNGQVLSGPIIICKGGTLKLEITNADAYPVGTQYEWFDNGMSIGKGTEPVMYLVPASTDNMVLSVTASDQSGSCPNTAVSSKTPVTFVAPEATAINYGATEAAICGKTPATLIADYTAGDGHYEWMQDGYTIPGQTNQTLMAREPGKYTVRYKSTEGCWSVVSVSINVIQSATLNMAWNVEPGNVKKGDQVTYTINSAPVAEQYKWSYSSSNPAAIVSIIPIGNGSSAVVQYGDKSSLPVGTDPEVTLIVQSVGHPCGDVTLKKTITVEDGCVEGTSVTLTPNGTITLTQGKHISFSASSNASNNDNDLKYEWFIDDVSQGAASTNNTFAYAPLNPGEYTVSVRVTNNCTPAADDLKAQAALNVKADPNNYSPDTSGNFKLTGKDCFDIAQSNFGGSCGAKAYRPGDFLDNSRNWVEGKQWIYTFTANANYTNLRFVINDPNVLVKSEKSDVKTNTHTLVFDESVLTKVLGKDRTNALNITVYALYEVNGTKKRVSLNVKVQDCDCGCGAYISRGVWKAFMCHNLGADETLDPLIPAAGLHGAKYKFGTPKASLTMAQDQSSASTIANWTIAANYPYQTSGTWNMTTNNPCPTGFRVPTVSEWEGVIANNAKTATGTWADAATNFSSGIHFGDRLFLPAAGSRFHQSGMLSVRGKFGYYWASNNRNSSGVGEVLRMVFVDGKPSIDSGGGRQAGYSVRCIAE
ncbi:MAG: PKD domain-containing protein [Prevotellaceae bacterium]|jgi:uncharacterized protein (TIGR02145 family)|nr:PKD domain-containing protein [Prevotellaceae bacterium]